MDSKKYEQLIELIVNENEDAAKALFHDIVVETSREIYESIMEEEMDEGMGGQVGTMMDEIAAEESGMTEAEDDEEFGDEEGMDDEGLDDEGMEDDEVVDLDADDAEGGDEERMDDLEDRVVSAEEKLEKLMAEFEDILAGEGDEEAADDEEMAADDEEEAADDEEMAADDEEEAADDEEEAAMMESARLVAVKKPAGGDHGANSRSVVAAKAKVPSPARAVNFDQGSSAGRSTPAVKPGKTYGNTGLGHKPRLAAAPKPTTKDASHSRSPLGESKVRRSK